MGLNYAQLGQSRPGDTSINSVYSPGAGVQAIIKRIVVCETAGGTAAFRICHDEDGTTYDETTAIYWDHAITANDTVAEDVDICMGDANGNLAVRSDTPSALTFTIYGVEIS